METEKIGNKKWYQNQTMLAYVLMSIVGTFIFITQQNRVEKEQVALKEQNAAILKQLDSLNHQREYKDAKLYNAMKETAKTAQEGYFAERRRNLLTLEVVKQKGCELPAELAVALQDRNLEPIENLLIQGNN